MRRLLALLLLPAALGLQAQEREIQRALVERDQQSAEFAAGARASELAPLHGRQLMEITVVPIPPELRPYQRSRMAEERELVLSPPIRKSGSEPDLLPLPLPGGPRHGVDPVLPQGFPG
ncbi:MAG TPA: hypothetical protein VG873_15730 [Burkholderiales bacterium]|nr:hypothetical protein [Burkholderiales bacterium]